VISTPNSPSLLSHQHSIVVDHPQTPDFNLNSTYASVKGDFRKATQSIDEMKATRDLRWIKDQTNGVAALEMANANPISSTSMLEADSGNKATAFDTVAGFQTSLTITLHDFDLDTLGIEEALLFTQYGLKNLDQGRVTTNASGLATDMANYQAALTIRRASTNITGTQLQLLFQKVHISTETETQQRQIKVGYVVQKYEEATWGDLDLTPNDLADLANSNHQNIQNDFNTAAGSINTGIDVQQGVINYLNTPSSEIYFGLFSLDSGQSDAQTIYNDWQAFISQDMGVQYLSEFFGNEAVIQGTQNVSPSSSTPILQASIQVIAQFFAQTFSLNSDNALNIFADHLSNEFNQPLAQIAQYNDQVSQKFSALSEVFAQNDVNLGSGGSVTIDPTIGDLGTFDWNSQLNWAVNIDNIDTGWPSDLPPPPTTSDPFDAWNDIGFPDSE
jgi:hypothetical protein